MNATIKEKSVSFQSGEQTLKGTLAIPDEIKEKYPTVLIIQGSGKLDRDGNANGKLKLNVYKQLAQFITSLGFITLRYDKRGVGESGGDFYTTGLWDLVQDAKSAIQFLKDVPFVDENKIVALGHSEGATLLPALNSIEPLHGMILLSGGGERLEEALKRQRTFLYEALNQSKGVKGLLVRAMRIEEKGEKKSLALYEKMKQTSKDVMRIQFQKVNVKWFREHLQYDVLQELEKVKCPMLAMTGDKDFQADAGKMERLPKLVKGSLEYFTIKDMDHGLKYQEGPIDVLKCKKTYIANGMKPLHEELCNHLAQWLQTQFQIESTKANWIILNQF